MGRHSSRCTVLRVVEDSQDPREPEELPPWADPYIARLLARHRLESALHDSLDFLRGSGGIEPAKDSYPHES